MQRRRGAIPRVFDPMVFFRELYKSITPMYTYSAKDPSEHARWERGLRRKFVELLGGFPATKEPLSPEVSEIVEFPDYVRERVLFNTRPLMSVPAYLLRPNKPISGKLPAIVCLPGHGPGKNTIVGFDDKGEPRQEIGGYQADFAIQAVRHGYVALAIEQLAFGERNSPDPRCRGCNEPSMNALMLGLTMIGLRVWDARRALDYLLTRPEVDPGRIGVMGISGGGTTTLYTAAVDKRFKAAVVSGYLCTFRDSIMAMDHCCDNFIPRIIRYAEMYDLAALVAPRALFAESGTKDSIFPIDAARFAFRKAKRAWDVLGVPDKIGHEVFEGEHQFWGKGAFEFLKRNL
ncbi:MAG TPA: alpha/beta hydrolase family protein [Candidatus Latescibacteria bacterium]|nr:alpha/beta hydrolase family protein [Candidatus Latescibacterota bacterium]